MFLSDEKKWTILQVKLQTGNVIRAFKILRAHKIEPILIKGLASYLKYPEDSQRLWFDIDLAVSSSGFKKVGNLKETGVFDGLNVDFHCGLRHLDTLPWKNLFENSQIVEVENYPIRILSEEDHLRVLCVHWLTDGGENKKRLLDIRYSVENRTEGFDWERCLGVVSGKRRRWIVSTIRLAGIYSGLEISALPDEIKDFDLPEWLPRTLEKVWSRRYSYMPLNSLWNEPKIFLYQLWRRFPPNPVMSIVGVNGHIDSRLRFIYQIEYLFQRCLPAVRRFGRIVYFKIKKHE